MDIPLHCSRIQHNEYGVCKHKALDFEIERKNARQINMLWAKRVTPIIIYGNYKASLHVYLTWLHYYILCSVQKRKVFKMIILHSAAVAAVAVEVDILLC